MKNVRDKKIIIMVFGVITLIAGLLGLSYAYFSSDPTGENQTTDMKLLSENLSAEFIDGQEITLSKMLPGFTVTKTFSIKNNSSAGMYYDIIFKDIESTVVGSDFVYTLTSTNNGGSVTETVMPTETRALVTRIYIEGKTTQTYTMIITFKNRPVDQSENQGAIFRGYLEFQSPYDLNGNIVSYEENFGYVEPSGGVQTFTPTYSGYYQIEAWGASGGRSKHNNLFSGGSRLGGLGGYTSGKIYLEVGETLNIYVGGKGSDGVSGSIVPGGWNGGGQGDHDHNDNETAGAGGGATDIRLGGLSLSNRIMVAGGGGGAALYGIGGFGGGLIGGPTSYSSGGTQINGYSFGVGAPGIQVDSNVEVGGGGYYGGVANSSGAANTYLASGAGGSSFISGYAGVVSGKLVNGSFVEPKDLASNSLEYNTLHYSGRYFVDGKMQSGINTGNGKVKITFVGTQLPIRLNTKLNNVRYIKDCMSDANSYSKTNGWSEIQAIKNGVNIAKDKDVTINFTSIGLNKEAIVDGNIKGSDTVRISDTSSTEYCVIIDLYDAETGITNYDLDEIVVWHWPDYRVWHNNFTQVSSDGTTWIEIMSEPGIETSEGVRITAYEEPLKGYIQDGLMVWYDGISNTGIIGNTTATSWKDLSGNNRNGAIKSDTTAAAIWGSNHLVFDGIDDWVTIGQLNYSNPTIEIVYESTAASESGNQYLIANVETGGIGLSLNATGTILRNSTYFTNLGAYNYLTTPVTLNKKYHAATSYNGSVKKLYKDGNMVSSYLITDTIKVPNSNTPMDGYWHKSSWYNILCKQWT